MWTDVEPDVFPCRFCGDLRVSGDEANNTHMLYHLPEYHRELERQGLSELEAHLKVNELVESLRTPAG